MNLIRSHYPKRFEVNLSKGKSPLHEESGVSLTLTPLENELVEARASSDIKGAMQILREKLQTPETASRFLQDNPNVEAIINCWQFHPLEHTLLQHAVHAGDEEGVQLLLSHFHESFKVKTLNGRNLLHTVLRILPSENKRQVQLQLEMFKIILKHEAIKDGLPSLIDLPNASGRSFLLQAEYEGKWNLIEAFVEDKELKELLSEKVENTLQKHPQIQTIRRDREMGNGKWKKEKDTKIYTLIPERAS